MSDKHHRHSKHTKLHQNLRGSLQFFVDWAWNDPYWIIYIHLYYLLKNSLAILFEMPSAKTVVKVGSQEMAVMEWVDGKI